MNKEDSNELDKYIRYIADEMELRDWTFFLSSDPCDKNDNGHIDLTYGRKIAIIKLCVDFRTIDLEQQRHTICHELIHCHFESAASMVLNDLEQHLGKQSDQLFYDGYKRQMEYGVDALASAISKHLPLIDWPKNKPIKASKKEKPGNKPV